MACSGSSHVAQPVSVTTYYLSLSGNDAAAGTSPSTAWRTLGRANRAILRPGDRLLLQGGQPFAGQLTIGPADVGSPAHPLVISSYGGGPATITSGRFGVYVHDTGGVRITELNVVGQSPVSNAWGPGQGQEPGGQPGSVATAGIYVNNDLPTDQRLAHVIIDHVYASGFGEGIAVGGVHSGAGFSDVHISDCLVSGNTDAGLETYGPQFNADSPTYANRNVTVLDVVASQNHGDPRVTSHNTGNGIVLGSVRDGRIIWSTADDNGGAGGDSTQGPTGIWAFDSTGISIEHSLSYDNQAVSKVDGNGFGLDQNTSDSVMQDNLSYGNAGPGFLIYSRLSNGAQKNNIVRYNISSDDANDGNTFNGGISIYGGTVSGIDVYQNTVVMSSASSLSAPALRLGAGIHEITIRNNVFMTDFRPVVAASQAASPAVATSQGNDYYSAAGAWSIIWGKSLQLARELAGSNLRRGSGSHENRLYPQPGPARPRPGTANEGSDERAKRGERLCSPRGLTAAGRRA